jgi:glycerol-3-phosphate dehydrogenase
MEGAGPLARALGNEYPFLPEAIVRRLVRSYGTRARMWLGNATSLADLGAHFGHGLYAAEADYLVAYEWARSSEDILWRRSKLGLRFTADEVAALESHVSAKVRNESV